ncbi:MAG: type 1 glutamine amidotransferase, partial [Gammaproteobacteria bacterium]|nr:type 1 glutamine amidotransferase [Gammaproteobacteria bacterium]
AMGAKVKANPVSEIGWHMTRNLPSPDARQWLDGLDNENLLFHWHSETFDLPMGAVPILSSSYCEHQGFVSGKTLALQCHIEMTADMVSSWCDINLGSLKVSDSVQSAEDMRDEIDHKIENLNQVAEKLYSVWMKGLK